MHLQLGLSLYTCTPVSSNSFRLVPRAFEAKVGEELKCRGRKTKNGNVENDSFAEDSEKFKLIRSRGRVPLLRTKMLDKLKRNSKDVCKSLTRTWEMGQCFSR